MNKTVRDNGIEAIKKTETENTGDGKIQVIKQELQMQASPIEYKREKDLRCCQNTTEEMDKSDQRIC